MIIHVLNTISGTILMLLLLFSTILLMLMLFSAKLNLKFKDFQIEIDAELFRE
ncbi:hypothetical protein HNR33_001300 [Brassicibacter mesophilus]|jgi:hypothetical protein